MIFSAFSVKKSRGKEYINYSLQTIIFCIPLKRNCICNCTFLLCLANGNIMVIWTIRSDFRVLNPWSFQELCCLVPLLQTSYPLPTPLVLPSCPLLKSVFPKILWICHWWKLESTMAFKGINFLKILIRDCY